LKYVWQTNHKSAPYQHSRRNPNGRTELLQANVRWNLQKGIREEEDSQADEILLVGYVDIILESV
jgi:hypothetical protein